MDLFRNREFRALERRLRAEAPQPSRALVSRFSPARRTRPQLALAGALTALLLVALASVGGVSYAATSVAHAVKVAAKAVVPSSHQSAIVVNGLRAGGDQYRPGYGFGDPNHNHSGPPNVSRAGGDKAPPLQAAPAGALANVVTAQVNFDEQAHLFISVIDSSGAPLLLTQQSKRGGSNVGGNGVEGPQTKFIQYAVLVPRTIPISLRIPDNLLQSGQIYRIRVVAIDPDGNKSTLLIPFRAP